MIKSSYFISNFYHLNSELIVYIASHTRVRAWTVVHIIWTRKVGL